MKLLKLQASFGKLHDTLELTGGLDLITAPNEAGKSTWTAFLIAMFYGIDTAERASKGNLPVKTKYKPWNGEAMQGAIDLEWNGRAITIERRSTAKSPMSDFRAYETETGLPVPELTADNCGEMIFGAKREVFLRSALLRQMELQITKDAELDQKLASLVTSGDETASFFIAEKRLRELRNRLTRTGTGALPQSRARLSEVERELESIRSVQQSCMELAASRKQLETKKHDLEELLERIGRAEQLRRARRLQDAKERLKVQEQAVEALREQTRGLPEISELHALNARCREAENALRTAEMENLTLPAAPEQPVLPDWFEGRSEQTLRKEAAQAQQKIRTLRETKRNSNPVWIAAAFVLALAGIFAGIFMHPALYALSAVFAALGVLLCVREQQKKKLLAKNRAQAEAICSRYSVSSEEDIPAALEKQIALQKDYEIRQAEFSQACEEAHERLTRAKTQLAEVLSAVQSFAPQAASVPEAFEALSSAERLHDNRLAEERALFSARQQLENLQQLIGTVPPETGEELEILEDEHEVRAAYQQTVRDLQNATDQLNIARGRLSAMGDAVELDAEKEQLTERIAALEKRAAAVSLAQERLAQANDCLQARFSPQLSTLAGGYFGELTGGSYKKLYLDRDMNIQVTKTDDPLQRPVQALSAGTADQLYFAVHLAMAELLLHADCPLILDDALINFDDERAKRALNILLRQSTQRQVILFSCHRREADFLREERERT